MKKEVKANLIKCHGLMCEALRAYDDRAEQSNKLSEIRQYSNHLPKEMNKKIAEYVNQVICPMVYDMDYWSFIEKDEQYGSYDNNKHFIVGSDCSLEYIIFSKYHHVLDLIEKLSVFMLKEFNLD